MKWTLGISDFLEEISSPSNSIVFLYFFALITEEGFPSLLAILWNSAIKWVYLSFSALPFMPLLFIAICKASSNNYFTLLFLGYGLDHCLLYNVMNLFHSSSDTLCIRSNPLNQLSLPLYTHKGFDLGHT